jgi:hypothetical protein
MGGHTPAQRFTQIPFQPISHTDLPDLNEATGRDRKTVTVGRLS